MTNQASTSVREAVEQRFFRTLNRFVEPAVRAGLGTSVAGPGAFVVETTGRRSGLPRRVPLLGTRVGDTIVVATVRRGSQWIRNVEKRPSVDVWVAGQRREATATVVRVPGGAVANLRLRPPGTPADTEPRQQHSGGAMCHAVRSPAAMISRSCPRQRPDDIRAA